MKRKIWWLAILLLLIDCQRVPITGRKQLSLLDSQRVNAMAFTSYDKVLKEAQLSENKEWTRWVKEVGHDIKGAVEKYLRENGSADLLEGYKWEFNLIADDMVNAWAMPGGKVAFYEGIMPICQNKQGVAVVMGHEVAHAIAQHGQERMSQGILQQLGGVAVAVATSGETAETQEAFMTAYGLGSQVGVMLPFSRKHESEADHMGIIFMAMAGYDPRLAPEFWKRMKAKSGGKEPNEFFSTHPSNKTRIDNLNGWMPEAMKYYKEPQAGQ